jgi:hypothetical protein
MTIDWYPAASSKAMTFSVVMTGFRGKGGGGAESMVSTAHCSQLALTFSVWTEFTVPTGKKVNTR